MRLGHRLLSGGLGAAALLAVSGCEEENEFAYFKVRPVLSEQADAEFRARIATCGVNVISAADSRVLDFASITCIEGQVGRELGLVDWSTAETSGKVRFVVTLKDRATREIAKGISDEFDIVPNTTVERTMQVDRLPDPMPMP